MDKITFASEQLIWLEDCPQCFVKVVKKGPGEKFSLDAPSTTVRIKELQAFIAQNPKSNLWRSWPIFRDQHCKDPVGCLPIVIDIDDESANQPNLYKAQRLTTTCLEGILEGTESIPRITVDDVRIIFSGRKGFHLEVKPPQTCEANKFRKELIVKCRQQFPNNSYGNRFFGSTSIDIFHKHVRLTNSLNIWYEKGHLVSRKVIRLPLKGFSQLSISDILTLAKSDES